jgi:GNAT superfamily N-acetyltransferase
VEGVAVRAARLDEIERVRGTYARWGYDRPPPDGERVLIAERGGQWLGLVRRAEEENVLVLRGMRVEDTYQRQGIGRLLLSEFVTTLGGRECFCLPNSWLIDFYGEASFREIDPKQAPPFLRARLADYLASGYDVTLMRNRLP